MRPVGRMLPNGLVVQGDVRRCVVLKDRDRERFVVGQSAGIGDANGHVVTGRRSVIQQPPVADDQVRPVDREPSTGAIRQGVGERVAGVGIRCGQGADLLPVGGVLPDGLVVQGDVRRRVVDAGDGDREDLTVGQSAGVGGPNGHGVTGRRFVIEQDAVADDQGGLVDREPPAGAIRQGVGERIPRVGVRCGQGADLLPVGGVLPDGLVVQGDVGRRVVGVGDRDRERFLIHQPAGVDRPDDDVSAGVGLVVQPPAVSDHQVRAVDGEPIGDRLAVVLVHHKCQCVPGIRIGPGKRADDRAVGGVLRDRAVGQGDVRRGFVEVADRDREGSFAPGPAGISRPHDDVVVGCSVVIQQAAVADNQIGPVDREPPARVVGQRVGVALTRIGVRHGQHADQRAVGGAIGYGPIVQCDVSPRVRDDLDREVVIAGRRPGDRAAAVGRVVVVIGVAGDADVVLPHALGHRQRLRLGDLDALTVQERNAPEIAGGRPERHHSRAIGPGRQDHFRRAEGVVGGRAIDAPPVRDRQRRRVLPDAIGQRAPGRDRVLRSGHRAGVVAAGQQGKADLPGTQSTVLGDAGPRGHVVQRVPAAQRNLVTGDPVVAALARTAGDREPAVGGAVEVLVHVQHVADPRIRPGQVRIGHCRVPRAPLEVAIGSVEIVVGRHLVALAVEDPHGRVQAAHGVQVHDQRVGPVIESDLIEVHVAGVAGADPIGVVEDRRVRPGQAGIQRVGERVPRHIAPAEQQTRLQRLQHRSVAREPARRRRFPNGSASVPHAATPYFGAGRIQRSPPRRPLASAYAYRTATSLYLLYTPARIRQGESETLGPAVRVRARTTGRRRRGGRRSGSRRRRSGGWVWGSGRLGRGPGRILGAWGRGG